MILKPQDILILIKLVALEEAEWSYPSLGTELSMSPSEVHSGLKRAVAARLMGEQRRRPIKRALEEFLIHGVKYAYPPSRGGLTRGVPTSFTGPPCGISLSHPINSPRFGLIPMERNQAMSSLPCISRSRKPQPRTISSTNCWCWWMPSATVAPGNGRSPSMRLKRDCNK